MAPKARSEFTRIVNEVAPNGNPCPVCLFLLGPNVSDKSGMCRHFVVGYFVLQNEVDYVSSGWDPVAYALGKSAKFICD
eukprot:2787850-Ditylum_brightwellii.AAC.1